VYERESMSVYRSESMWECMSEIGGSVAEYMKVGGAGRSGGEQGGGGECRWI
jgi:hypothetical protein